MTVETHELRLALSDHEIATWKQRAASHGLSVQDFIRRAVGAFDGDQDAELQALHEQASRIETKAVTLAAAVMSLKS